MRSVSRQPWLFVGSAPVALLLGTLAMGACAAGSPAIPDDLQIRVGTGGGITGATRTVRLDPDGALIVEFDTVGRAAIEVPAGRLDDDARREAWAALDGVDVAALGCTPGNMTDHLEVRRGGVTQRACAWMDTGPPAFRSLFDRLERIVAAPAAGVRPPPPPLPPMPAMLWMEVDAGAARVRVAREGAVVPPRLAEGVALMPDAVMEPLWRSVFSAQFYSGASIEDRDGQVLPGAPFPCPAGDRAVRVGSGTEAAYEVRSRCTEGDAAMADLADAVMGARR